MINDEVIAKEISDLMIEYSAKLNASVALVQSKCSEGELQTYRRAVGTIMGDMLLNVMNPLYAKHLKLKPRGLE